MQDKKRYFEALAKLMRQQHPEEQEVGLASDQIPHEDAGAPSAEEVAPEMEDMLQDELVGADEIDQRGLREARLRQLFNPK